MLGIGDARTTGKAIAVEYGSFARADEELEKLKRAWHARLGSLVVGTPDKDIDHTVKCLGPLQLPHHVRMVARREPGVQRRARRPRVSATRSRIYTGRRRGDSGRSAETPRTHAHWPTYRTEGRFPSSRASATSQERRRLRRPRSIARTTASGSSTRCPTSLERQAISVFYNKVLPYADAGEATVFGHLRRALDFNLETHGKAWTALRASPPIGTTASAWATAARAYLSPSSSGSGSPPMRTSRRAWGKRAEADWALEAREKLDANIQATCWDGKWFIWAIAEDGTVYGTKDYEEGQVYFNTQVWSVLSGAANPTQAASAMATVKERLATPYGLMLSAPPFAKTSIEVMRAVVFNPGIKENAGIFKPYAGLGASWPKPCSVMGDRAFEYCKASLPAAYNDKAEIRQCEPYVQGQTTYSTFSPRPGNTPAPPGSRAPRLGRITALRSTSWASVPEYDGLRIDPCLPSDWKGFKAERRFRGKRVTIEVRNPKGLCKGIASLELNGEKLEGSLVPAGMLKAENTVVAVMG